MISIIVPIYNAEKYIRRCIESILCQTYCDFELLVVDDGSDDSSHAICDEYAKQDHRVRVLHKRNGGVSSARNLGLDNASGEWVAFCDADDYVSPLYLENLYRATDNSDIDLVLNYAIVHNGGEIKEELYPSRVVDLSDVGSLFFENDLIWHTSPWSKLFRRNIIECERLRFAEGVNIGEDAVFLYTYMLHCRKIRTVCTCDYNYMINSASGSLTQRINSFASELKGLEAITEAVERIKAICPQSTVLESKFGWLTGCYKRRTLLALYHEKMRKDDRIAYLVATDFTDYFAHCVEDSVQGRLYQWLLKSGNYKMYDLVRYLIKKIKS